MENELSIFEHFRVTCDRCGGTCVETEDTRGSSEASGEYGCIWFHCVDCDNRESLY
jgi:hypothetical protein